MKVLRIVRPETIGGVHSSKRDEFRKTAVHAVKGTPFIYTESFKRLDSSMAANKVYDSTGTWDIVAETGSLRGTES